MSVEDEPPQSDKTASGHDADLLKNVQAKVGDIANRWLKDRFGLREDADGTTRDDAAWVTDLAGRAEHFVRGFFKGFLEKPPEDAGGKVTMASVADAMTRLLARTGQTVNHAFQDYLRDKAVDHEHPKEPVVLDGRFVVQHGAPLISRIVQALGGAFAGGESEAAPETPEPEPVDVRVELPEVFKSLLGGRPGEPATTEASEPMGPAPEASEKDPT